MNPLPYEIELKLRQISKMLNVHHNIVAQSSAIVDNDFRHATMDVLMGTINELCTIRATLIAGTK
jgi:hypothetical protein